MFERITEAEIDERSMANVSTTPGRRTAFGEGGLDAKALKLRFDRLGRYLAKRLNEVFDGIADGSLAEVLYIDSEGEKRSLKDFVDSLLTGQVESIKIQTSDGVITLTELGNRTQEMYNGLDTGDLAGKIKIIEGVTLKKFYEDFLKLEDNISPVKSVNGKTGEVTLNAKDVGARPDAWMPTAQEVGADPSGSALTAVSGHNVQTNAHNDIRLELQRLAGIIADLLDSDDATLDEMHEIVAYIKSNKALIEAITTSKVNVADIIDNLTTNVSNKPLSAAQGVALKALIDNIAAGSEESMLGEWEFNEEITTVLDVCDTPEKLQHWETEGYYHELKGDAIDDYGNRNQIESIQCVLLNGELYGDVYDNIIQISEFNDAFIYDSDLGWQSPREFVITKEPSAKVSTWIKANAKRKEPIGVDKITEIDTWASGVEDIFADDADGIQWQDKFNIFTGEDIEGTIYHRVPLVAGENVTFDIDSENGVVKINATGTSSTDESIVGTWRWNETLSFDALKTTENLHQCLVEVDVTDNLGNEASVLSFRFNEDGEVELSLYYREDQSSILIWGVDGWDDAFDFITFLSEIKNITTYPEGGVSKNDFITFMKDNAKKQGGSNSGNSTPFELPRIRFANFQYVDDTYYRFTVENLGGGTLQVGDKLQICCRRKYPGGKKKLRQMAFYEITEEDINQRFLKIEVDPNDESNHKWLFRNDSKASHSTFSAMYFRLKRVTKYSGMDGKECDAIFSNVETVWKTFYMVEDEKYSLKIK